MVHWDAFNNPIPIFDRNNTIAVRMGLIHINHHVQEQFKIAGEIEDLKVARKLQQEKEDAKLAMEFQYFECGNLMSELQNLHPEDKKEDAKLAREIQYFECENLMSELQNLHPDDKKEYFDRNALFFKKCRREIKIQKEKEGTPTTINTPKLEIIRIKKRSHLIDCTASPEPTAPPEPTSPTKPGESEIVVLHDEDFHIQNV